MSISKKYGIPESAVIALYRDGHLPESSKRCFEIADLVKEHMTKGKCKTDAVCQVSEDLRCSERHVWDCVKNCTT